MAELDSNALWRQEGDNVSLRAVRCTACGSVQFPPQEYGCEECGADGASLETKMIDSSGTIHTFTTVYLHEKLETPYMVAEVNTAARQPIRGRLDHHAPVTGAPVRGEVRLTDGEPAFVFVPNSEV